MSTKIINGLKLAGLSIRTTNQNGQAQKDIGALWKKWMTEYYPFKISGKIYCVYTDYESDFTGEYTAFLGCEVAEPSIAKDPALACSTFDHVECLVFQTENNSPAGVLKAWQEIWGNPSLKRSYAADFEIYDFSQPAENNFAEILISI